MSSAGITRRYARRLVDLAGHVLEQEPWEVVRLPALADEQAYRVETTLGPQTFGRQVGEALHPAREYACLGIQFV